jgi:phenylacetate-CoA ligase
MSQGPAVAVRELWYLVEALSADRRSRAAVERRALRGVRRMLERARSEVPHYRDPAYAVHLESLADVARLPVLTKEAVRAAPEDFQAPERGWFQVDRTSGSTGRVLRVRHDAHAYGYHGATLMRRFLAAGCRPWWTIAHIKPYPRPNRWFQRLGVFRRTVVPAGLPERELAERVLALRPRVLMGYPVMLRALLRELSDAELAVLRRRLRLLLSESELLTDDVRALLSRGYGVPVRDEYSAFEVLTIAHECRHGWLHVDEDRVLLEVADAADHRRVPDGTPGVAVVTHFRERAMPLVRYLIDDRVVAVPGACPCGSRFRRMRLLDGRSEDAVVLPDGRRIYFGAFAVVGLTVLGLTEISVRQDEHGAITVSIVLDRTAGRSYEDVAADVRACLHRQLGREVPLEVVRVDRIELTPGGKARLVSSAYAQVGEVRA